MVGLCPAAGYQLVVQLSRQWEVGEAIAVDVAHLLASIPVFDAAEPVRECLHPGPRRHPAADFLSGASHAPSFSQIPTLANRQN